MLLAAASWGYGFFVRRAFQPATERCVPYGPQSIFQDVGVRHDCAAVFWLPPRLPQFFRRFTQSRPQSLRQQRPPRQPVMLSLWWSMSTAQPEPTSELCLPLVTAATWRPLGRHRSTRSSAPGSSRHEKRPGFALLRPTGIVTARFRDRWSACRPEPRSAIPSPTRESTPVNGAWKSSQAQSGGDQGSGGDPSEYFWHVVVEVGAAILGDTMIECEINTSGIGLERREVTRAVRIVRPTADELAAFRLPQLARRWHNAAQASWCGSAVLSSRSAFARTMIS